MKFWDSSALIAFFVTQSASAAIRAQFRTDPQIAVWMLTDVEVHSALARLEREGALSLAQVRETANQLGKYWPTFLEVSLIAPVKARATRLLATHPLRAADALQLAAALVATSDAPAGTEFVCLDRRLRDAAQREGFTLVPAEL